MNVMNRKLFANRDARRKLANMGGIIASSPELLGTAQTFQDGGGAFPRQEYADMLSGFQDLISDRRLYNSFAATNPQIFGDYGFGYDFYNRTSPGERRDLVRNFVASRFGEDAAREIFSRLPGVTSGGFGDPTIMALKGPRSIDAVLRTGRQEESPLRYENLADSVETRKGLASIYQQPNVELTSSPILNQESEISTQNDLTEFEKIRQGMDAVPEAGEKVSDSALGFPKNIGQYLRELLQPVGEKGKEIGQPIGTTLKETYSSAYSNPDLIGGILQLASQDPPEVPEGFTTVTLNRGTTSMAVFDYNPKTGEVIPRGTNAELMYSGSNKAQANVQNMVQEQYNLDYNIKPVVEAEKEADITQQIYESDPSGENLELASEARKKELEVKKEINPVEPTEVDRVLSRTTPFVDPPSAMDELEKEFLKKREEERGKRELAEFEKIRDSMDAVPEAGSKEEAESNKVISDLGKAVNEEANKEDGGSPANAGADVFFNAVGVDSSNMTLKEKVTSMKEIYTDLLGYDDEDESELFWLNMAQIGFLVASGQDPNALANIAAGFAQGASKFAEDKRDKKARDDKMTLAAFSEVMADERAKTKFGYDMQIAAIRAAKSVGTQEPFVDAVRVLAQKGLDSGMYETIEESLAAADAALRPYYTSTTATGNQAEETVKVVQNGETIEVPVSQIPTQQKVLTEEKG